MEVVKENKQQTDLSRFITGTLCNAITSSKSRTIIFCIILFLQFWAASYVIGFQNKSYPDTYNGLTQKLKDINTYSAWCVLVKYILLLTIIFISPRESTGKRRFGKYVVLFGALFLWFIADAMWFGFEREELENEIAVKSFQENQVPIYGKVVFASYKRDESYKKSSVAIAGKLSELSNGYLIIVHIDSSNYPYSGLTSLLRFYNDYCSYKDLKTNIPLKFPELPGCIQFEVDFPRNPEQVPGIPEINKYVKILYDPIENGIQLFVDSSTMKTPMFENTMSGQRYGVK